MGVQMSGLRIINGRKMTIKGKKGEFWEKTIWEDSKKFEGETLTKVHTGKRGTSDKKGTAIQIVWDRGNHFVHIHCKTNNCENEWKEKEGTTYEKKFEVIAKEEVEDENGWYLEVTCKKCETIYYVNL